MESITRIPAPKFKIGRYSLNEYELRCLMVEIAEGKSSHLIGKTITDSFGDKSILNNDGTLSGRLKGLSIATDFALKSMEHKNRNRTF